MMTLDELLGKETETETQQPQVSTGFMSYEEFRARSNGGYARTQNDYMRGADTYTQNRAYSMPEKLPEQREYAEDLVRPSRPQSFYEYVARQKNTASDEELFNRLSQSNGSLRPVFDQSASAQSEAVFQDSKSAHKQRSRLNLKGKIILGVFLAFVVTAVSLVIGFAGKINSGTAVVPASNANATAIVSTQTSNF